MAAQRNQKAHIVAIDIVEDAVAQARRNVDATAWKERIEVVAGDANDFFSEHKFDHIVSNPPFFTETLQSPSEARRVARHATTLTYDNIVEVAERLLRPGGRISVILPYDAAMMFRGVAFERLWLRRLTNIVTREGDVPKRTLMEFVLTSTPIMPRSANIAIQRRDGSYTEEYMRLTEEFYLNF
jgi:tRNA1Val (adenine37-N6)-methyltransferase